MSRIAAPEAITRHPLADAPPGHSFALYLPLWNTRWTIDDEAKRNALERCCTLGNSTAMLDALRARQLSLAKAVPNALRLVVDAIASSPFATGLGNEHPVENGFAFLTPYGLPYLAGSGVKGVLRRAMQELTIEKTDGIDNALIAALFGPEDPGTDGTGLALEERDRRRGALAFWDVFPSPPEGRLCVEVMTPHQGDYYQGKQSPHDAGRPIPIHFLALLARSKLRFIVTLQPRFMPAELGSADWQTPLRAAFERAFAWLGFGAKTAVGYGAMDFDQEEAAQRGRDEKVAEARRADEEAQAQRQQALAGMSPTERAIREFLDARADRNQPELAALLAALKRGQWSGEAQVAIATYVRAEMQRARKWKERSEKKNPQKDHDHQDTLMVMKWLDGQSLGSGAKP